MNTLLAPELSISVPDAEDADPQPRRWTREEYYRMADAGILRPEERTELIDGEIIVKMSPMKSPHTIALGKTEDAVKAAFSAGHHTRTQSPLALGSGAEPEPDVLVVAGERDDYADHPMPQDALLLVEVSDSTLSYDLGRKAGLYSRVGVADYWVLNLKARTLTVHRVPSDAGYEDVQLYAESESVAPLHAPAALVSVSSLLPRLRPEQG